MFTVVPLTWCPHLKEGVAHLPPRGLHVKDPCLECGHVGENWLCLQCYEVSGIVTSSTKPTGIMFHCYM